MHLRSHDAHACPVSPCVQLGVADSEGEASEEDVLVFEGQLGEAEGDFEEGEVEEENGATELEDDGAVVESADNGGVPAIERERGRCSMDSGI